MHNDNKNKNGVDPVPESAILHANKFGMPTPKNSVAANKIGHKNINEREYRVQYGKDASCLYLTTRPPSKIGAPLPAAPGTVRHLK